MNAPITETPGGAMVLARGGGWHGTFVNALQTVVRDILDDGEPFTATVTVEYRPEPVTVSVAAADDKGFGSVHRWIHWVDVDRIEII